MCTASLPCGSSMCSVKRLLSPNVFPHESQRNGFSSATASTCESFLLRTLLRNTFSFPLAWSRLCLNMLPVWLKRWPQMLHLYGFSPVWILVCMAKVCLLSNAFPHVSHRYGFSGVTAATCFPLHASLCCLKYRRSLNCRPQFSHVCSFVASLLPSILRDLKYKNSQSAVSTQTLNWYKTSRVWIYSRNWAVAFPLPLAAPEKQPSYFNDSLVQFNVLTPSVYIAAFLLQQQTTTRYSNFILFDNYMSLGILDTEGYWKKLVLAQFWKSKIDRFQSIFGPENRDFDFCQSIFFSIKNIKKIFSLESRVVNILSFCCIMVKTTM